MLVDSQNPPRTQAPQRLRRRFNRTRCDQIVTLSVFFVFHISRHLHSRCEGDSLADFIHDRILVRQTQQFAKKPIEIGPTLWPVPLISFQELAACTCPAESVSIWRRTE